MKAFACLVAGALLVAVPAWAGKTRAPAFSWTGCYVGAAAGGAWSDQNVSTSGSAVGNQAPVGSELNGSNGIASVYGGCNWQFAPTWVVGVEGDFGWTDLDDAAGAPNLYFNRVPVGVGGISWSQNLDRLGSVRGRVGFAAAPELLIFATGGFAWAHSDFAGVNRGSSSSRSTSFGETREGYVVGAGTDWAPWHDNWVLRLEYLHYEFSGTSSTVFFPNPNTFYWDDESVDSVRAGLSYKF